MKHNTILFYILGLLTSTALGSLSAHRSDHYTQMPLRHNSTTYSQPRANATFKIAAAGRVLGLSTAPHAQNRYPFARMALLNRDAHNIILPSVSYCKELTATQCAYFINYWLHKDSSCFRTNMLQQYPYYACPGFVQILQTFPEYEQHILYVAQQVHQNLLWTAYAKWHGIQDTIYQLEQEVHQIQHQRQKIKAAQDVLDKQLAQQRNTLENLYNIYDHEPEEGLLGKHQTQRAQSGRLFLQSNQHTLYNQSYQLRTQTHLLLRKHGIEQNAITEFNYCFGNKLQQSVHQEFIEILDSLAVSNRTNQFHDLDKLTIDFAIIGVQANKAGNIVRAYTLADFGWAVIDVTQAVGEGIIEGTQQTVNTFLHPVDTVTNIGKGLGKLIYYLGKVIYELGDIGITACFDSEQAQTKWENYAARTKAFCSALNQKIRSIPPRDVVRAGVAFATETFLTDKCLGAIHTFAHASHAKALDLARKARAGEVVATTAEGFQVRFANKAIDTFAKMEKAGEKVKGAVNSIKRTSQWAIKEAEKLGFKKTNYYSHGQPVFQRKNRYITLDVDGHNGGIWKMADSVKNLSSKKLRMGTYDKNLIRIGG